MCSRFPRRRGRAVRTGPRENFMKRCCRLLTFGVRRHLTIARFSCFVPPSLLYGVILICIFLGSTSKIRLFVKITKMVFRGSRTPRRNIQIESYLSSASMRNRFNDKPTNPSDYHLPPSVGSTNTPTRSSSIVFTATTFPTKIPPVRVHCVRGIRRIPPLGHDLSESVLSQSLRFQYSLDCEIE